MLKLRLNGAHEVVVVQANLGKMDQTSAAWKLIGANLALTQVT